MFLLAVALAIRDISTPSSRGRTPSPRSPSSSGSSRSSSTRCRSSCRSTSSRTASSWSCSCSPGSCSSSSARPPRGRRPRDAIPLLIGVAVVSTIVNFDSSSAIELDSPIKPVFYFVGFLLVFALVASTIDRIPNVDSILRALVVGGDLVALFASTRHAGDTTSSTTSAVRARPRPAGARGVGAPLGSAARAGLVAAPIALLGGARSMMLPIVDLPFTPRVVLAARSSMWIGAASCRAIAARGHDLAHDGGDDRRDGLVALLPPRVGPFAGTGPSCSCSRS